MNGPMFYSDMTTDPGNFAPYSLPDDLIPEENTTKYIFAVQPVDRSRAEQEILQCGDILFLAKPQLKHISIPRFYSGDIVFDARQPSLVYDIASDRITDLHFTVKTDACELRGILYYAENVPHRYILDLYQGKYIYSVIAVQRTDGSFEIERTGRTVRPDKPMSRLRRAIPALLLAVCAISVVASLLAAYLHGRALRDAEPSEVTDTTDVAVAASSEITMLYLTDPIKPGKNVTVQIMGKPNTLYAISVSYEHNDDIQGMQSSMSNAQGLIQWTWRVGSGVDSGSYTIKVSGGGTYSVFPFFVSKP